MNDDELRIMVRNNSASDAFVMFVFVRKFLSVFNFGLCFKA